jgi:hypothetical protein
MTISSEGTFWGLSMTTEGASSVSMALSIEAASGLASMTTSGEVSMTIWAGTAEGAEAGAASWAQA